MILQAEIIGEEAIASLAIIHGCPYNFREHDHGVKFDLGKSQHVLRLSVELFLIPGLRSIDIADDRAWL